MGGLSAASTIVESLTDFFLRKPGGDRAEPYQAMLGSGYTYIAKWLPELWTMMVPGMGGAKQSFTAFPLMKNNIVLKQFRDAHETDSACYQALVKSEISIDKIIDAGLLLSPLSGDTSGGITVRLHHYDTQPIVETLGLEVSGISSGHGGPVTTLNQRRRSEAGMGRRRTEVCAVSQMPRPAGIRCRSPGESAADQFRG